MLMLMLLLRAVVHREVERRRRGRPRDDEQEGRGVQDTSLDTPRRGREGGTRPKDSENFVRAAKRIV